MAKELGFGLLGAGLVAPFHARSLKDTRGGKLVAICDSNRERADKLAASYPARVYVDLRVSGMTASCDAWFYNNWLGIPTVVYGPGALKHAHTKDEQISGVEVAKAAEVLLHAACDWCGA